jgi:flavin-dependent dehydrogenase
MYEAFVSARLAAEAIAAGAVERYEPALRARLDPLARAGWGAKVALDRFPRATFTVLRFPLTWKVIEQVMLGDLGHPGAARGLQRRSMQLVEALARRAGDPGRAFASV